MCLEGKYTLRELKYINTFPPNRSADKIRPAQKLKDPLSSSGGYDKASFPVYLDEERVGWEGHLAQKERKKRRLI